MENKSKGAMPRLPRVALSSGEIAVLPNEISEDLTGLIAELNQQFEPKTGTERFLVDQMVHARWKLARYRRLEAVAFEQIAAGEASPDDAILTALTARGNILDKLERLIAAQDRAFSKAVRELHRLRAEAAKTKKQNEANAAEAWLQAELAKLQNEPIPEPFFPAPRPAMQNEAIPGAAPRRAHPLRR